jgi:hypothetical protein
MNKPKFGWVDHPHYEPFVVEETKFGESTPVAVIPLPFMSAKMQKRVQDFAASINPK